MAHIHRRADTFSKQVRRRNLSNRAFLHGLISGFVVAAILFAFCFCLLGPVIYGEKPKEEPSSFAEQSAPSSETSSLSVPVSQAESDEAHSEEPSSLVPSSEAKPEMSSAPRPEDASPAEKPAEKPEKKPVDNLLNNAYLEDSVFIGDSITQGLGLYLPDLNATVLGVRSLNPDTLFTVQVKGPKGAKMTIPKATVAYRPKVIYMMIGTNGLAFLSQDYMISRLETCIDFFRKELPHTRIVLEAIPPVSRGKYNSDHRFSVKNIDAYNARLKKLAEAKEISFLNVNDLFRDKQGYLPSAETPDGIHFYKQNYLKWLNFILEDADAFAREQAKKEAQQVQKPALPENHRPEAA